MGFILKDQKFSLVWFDRHHRFLAVLTYWPFSLLAHHTETSLSWQFWPPEKKYERRIKHHFLTNKNVFGFPRGRSEAEIGEAICQLVFFFLYCIAPGRTRSFFYQNLVFSLGSVGGIFYFCKHF